MTDNETSSNYMVLFIGEIRHGISPSTLKQRMASTFNVSIARIERLFTGRPEIIKNNVNEATAQRYCDALKSLGAVSWIEPMPPFYRKYVDRRKNSRTRRSSSTSNERRNGPRSRMGTDRRERRGRRYHDR
ncbi:MAG: hypothetical protein KDJ38_07660 [Gammaproteobacteria bacterium]|nr:hypothetical protein [Gammaproteobacteria bacterium]